MSEPSAPTVLVADDDPFIVNLYRDKLTRAGLTVEVVTNGEEALRRLARNPPALLLLDLNMPRVDGVEVLRFVRGSSPRPDLPVVVLSNACTPDMVAAVTQLQPTRFLTKRETSPNNVVNEIVALVGRPSDAPTPPTARVSGPPAADREAALRAFENAPAGPDAQDALLTLYPLLQDDLRTLKAASPLTPAHAMGTAVERLFEDLYARPDLLHAAAVRALSETVKTLPALTANAGDDAPPAMPILIVSEEEATRYKLRTLIDHPPFLPWMMRREAAALDALDDNPLAAAIWDAGKPSAARQVKKRLRSVQAGRFLPLLCLVDGERMHRLDRDFEDVRTGALARPVLDAECLVRLLALTLRPVAAK